MAFNPSQDLNSIQKIVIQDSRILDLLDLTGKSNVEVAKKIIKRSQWDGLATSDKRLCIFFVPDRRTRNSVIMESIIEIDIHVPMSQDFKAWEVQQRIKELFHNRRVNKKYMKFDGQLGELPTMDGFFCCGSRFRFNRLI